jgi:pimeloyl-ACP methyl ester carboxylesterase
MGSTVRPPLLFVHGAWHGAWCWKNFRTFFAERGWNAHALDLRGHGGARTGRRLTHSISDYVDDVARASASLPQAPVIVAHSMGAFILHHYLKNHAAAGAIFVTPIPPRSGAWGATVQAALRHPIAFARVNLTMRLWPMVETVERATDLLFSSEMPRALAAEYHSQLQDESYRAYLGMLLKPVMRPPVDHCPVLVLGGAEDVLVRPGDVRATGRFYGTAPVVFPGMAHDLMLEPRWTEVAERIEEWLRGADFAAVRA